MTENYNSGEWSEFYAFLKVLQKRELPAADENLNPVTGVSYPVTKVIHDDKNLNRIYDISDTEKIKVRIYKDNIDRRFEVKYSEISKDIRNIYLAIKNKKSSKGSFPVPEASRLRNLLENGDIKKGSRSKEDIILIVRDQVTSQETSVGFSIKSYIGGVATLLNSSGATSFTFKANNFNLNIDVLNAITGHRKLRKRVDNFLKAGGNFEFEKTGNKKFEKNLRMIDSFLPEILSEMLKAFFSSKGNSTSELTKYVIENNCLKGSILESFDYLDIKYKVKQLLINSALGMVPASEWDGFIKADGGYIIVREDGDVVCYHVYNISYLSEYLFNNTKFETGSSSRTGLGFGKFYEIGNDVFYDYRLQIRFSL